jgi:hypothetical protein
MAPIDIELDKHAPPVVRGVGATLRRAAADPKLAKRLGKMKGVLALRSSADPQTVTARFDRGKVRVTHGLAHDADVVITLDWGDMAGKPKVSGAARHPLFALGVAKVMEPPLGTWKQEADRFWTFARDTPRMPSSLRVVCTDDASEVQFGESGPPAYEIHGSADALRSIFSGSSVLGQDALDGKVLVVGSFEHISILTGRSIAWVMGEGR